MIASPCAEYVQEGECGCTTPHTARTAEDWNLREDVTEELTETHGWIQGPEESGHLYTRRNAVWWVNKADGSSVLDVTGYEGEPTYTLHFSAQTPAYLVARACAEAAADCHLCGIACEGDHAPDGIYNGEVR